MDDILILLGDEANEEQVEVIYKLIETRLLNICKGYITSFQLFQKTLNIS